MHEVMIQYLFLEGKKSWFDQSSSLQNIVSHWEGRLTATRPRRSESSNIQKVKRMRCFLNQKHLSVDDAAKNGISRIKLESVKIRLDLFHHSEIRPPRRRCPNNKTPLNVIESCGRLSDKLFRTEHSKMSASFGLRALGWFAMSKRGRLSAHFCQLGVVHMHRYRRPH
jgi:hypothetical protein